MKSFLKLGVGFILVVLLAIGGVFWLTAGEDPDLEKLYATLMMDVRNYSGDQVMSFFTSSYNHNGMNFNGLARLVKTYLQPDQFERIDELHREIKVQSEGLALIEAEYRVHRKEMGYSMRVPLRVRVRLEKDSGRWLITAVDYEILQK